MVYLARELDDLPQAVPPEGFELRTVHDADVESRVEAHRSAFHPSRVTVESYRNVMARGRTAPTSTASRSRRTAALPRTASPGSTTRTARESSSP